MTNLFEAKSPSHFLRARMKTLPNEGRGELRRLSLETSIHTTTMSQIFSGTRHLSLEQAAKLCSAIALNETETRYFLLMLLRDRAGTTELREVFESQMTELRAEAEQLSKVIRKDRSLSESEKAHFYSNWFFTGIAVLCSIPSLQTLDALVAHTRLPRTRVKQVLDFLVQSGISVESGGRYSPGSQTTHLDSKSPLISRHHSNWRVRAMEKHPALADDELAYSGPMSISAKDAARIRSLLAKAVRDVHEIRNPSPCEEAYCLNIDWFRI